MGFKLTPRFLLFAGLCVCLTSGELWLRHGLATQHSRIVFRSLRDGVSEIYVMNAVGGNQENLTNHPAFDNGPDWSPDGTKIAFVSNRSDVSQIYVMDANGKNPIQVRPPSCLPPFLNLAHQSFKKSRLLRILKTRNYRIQEFLTVTGHLPHPVAFMPNSSCSFSKSVICVLIDSSLYIEVFNTSTTASKQVSKVKFTF